MYCRKNYCLFVCRVFSEKGLPYLKEEFPKLKFKGKGHEVREGKKVSDTVH